MTLLVPPSVAFAAASRAIPISTPCPSQLVPSSTSISGTCCRIWQQQYLTTTSCTTTTATCTQLSAAPVPPMQDYSSAAVAFFTSIRVPSALVAGSQLGSLFSLVRLLNASNNTSGDDNKKRHQSQNTTRDWLIRLYHLFSLTALVLSINAIVTATAAATKLLMGSHDGVAESAYQFINRELRYEFILTRWSFLTSLLSFLAGITIRALLEFNLLDEKRRKAAVVVASSMAGLFCHLLSFVNSTLISAPNLFVMTLQVVKLMVANAFGSPRRPLEMASLVCFAYSFYRAIPLLSTIGGTISTSPDLMASDELVSTCRETKDVDDTRAVLEAEERNAVGDEVAIEAEQAAAEENAL